MEEKNESHWSGKPMDEESLKEHLKAFQDIEDCIEALYAGN